MIGRISRQGSVQEAQQRERASARQPVDFSANDNGAEDRSRHSMVELAPDKWEDLSKRYT